METKHYLVRATMVPEIIKMIIQDFTISENEALDLLYTSPTGELLADDETGLYGQSPLYIYSLLKEDLGYRE